MARSPSRPTARRLAASIIRPPIVGLPGPAIDLLATPGLALLPARIRVAYRRAMGPVPRKAGPCRRRELAHVGGADAARLAFDAAGSGGRPAGTWRLGQRRMVRRYNPPDPPLRSRPPVPSQDLSRRAVVTGLGAVTPIGNDHPTFWRNLVAGVSGAGPITSFDATGYDVRIAAEVKDFDPTVAMDRKMARRMSRFIHLGHGRRQGGRRGFAARLQRLEPGASRSCRGLRQHRRRWPRPGHRRRRGGARERPQLRQPLRHPGALGLDGGLPALDGLRPDRPGHHPGRRLRQQRSSPSSTPCA